MTGTRWKGLKDLIKPHLDARGRIYIGHQSAVVCLALLHLLGDVIMFVIDSLLFVLQVPLAQGKSVFVSFLCEL